jgi:hypothetical protein
MPNDAVLLRGYVANCILHGLVRHINFRFRSTMCWSHHSKAMVVHLQIMLGWTKIHIMLLNLLSGSKRNCMSLSFLCCRLNTIFYYSRVRSASIASGVGLKERYENLLDRKDKYEYRTTFGSKDTKTCWIGGAGGGGLAKRGEIMAGS